MAWLFSLRLLFFSVSGMRVFLRSTVVIMEIKHEKNQHTNAWNYAATYSWRDPDFITLRPMRGYRFVLASFSRGIITEFVFTSRIHMET
ncbi:hypothetical protein K449DRAFT_143706 [Hypoxylon sp. EC38]|nr:hypothetical protein K449DRAFT_143706 [Hypoxylon sp. EC38]